MHDKIEAAKRAYNDACQRLNERIAEAEALPDDADAEDIEAAAAAVAEAEATADERKAEVERWERIAEARQTHTPLALSTPTDEPRVKVGAEPPVYRPDDHSVSFLRDLFAAARGDQGAAERLRRNDMQVMEKRDVTSSDPGAGSFIPPIYAASLWQDLPRPGRAFVDQIPTMPFPDAGLTIDVPKVQSGVSVAVQAAENNALSETDIDTQTVSSTMATIGGIQDISAQALERSFPGMDMVILDDLRRAYDAQLESQVLTGSGSSGQLLGILNVSGNNDITWTEATPAQTTGLKRIYECFAEIATDTEGSAAANLIVMHHRRGAWFASGASSNAPLFQQGALFAAWGPQDQGYAGSVGGIPVVYSAAVPTTRGASTNQDVIFVVDRNVLRLAEAAPRVEVFRDGLSANLTVRFRLYSYVFFVSNRLPAALANIEGTGLVAPSFA